MIVSRTHDPCGGPLHPETVTAITGPPNVEAARVSVRRTVEE